jgi:outer membrane protein assembly factor BamB
MKSPITHMKQTASFRVVVLMFTIATLWLMLAAANTSAHAQTSNSVSDASAASLPADWTQFHRDNMQRWNPYETVLGVNNVGSLQLKWKNPIGRGSTPAVVNGVIYFDADDGNLYALNASTGAKLWSFAAGADLLSPPAVANGVVYIVSNEMSGAGTVYALNPNTGAKLWSFANDTPLADSFVVANGVVYVGCPAPQYH